jgi:16S rRNA processing protein RimM
MGHPNSSITLGTIGAPVGLKGWVSVQLCMETPEDLAQYQPCYIQKQGELVPIHVDEIKPRGKNWVIKIRGVEDRTQAEAYRLLPIVIHRDALAALPEGEYYWADLEGLDVWSNQKCIGKIESLYHNSGIDIMVVTKEGHTQQIPFIFNDTVLSVDLNEKKVQINWPETML